MKCRNCYRDETEAVFDTSRNICRECRLAYHREYYKKNQAKLYAMSRADKLKNPERTRAYGRAYNRRLREAAFEHYGRVCVCCGESRDEFLNIDHINGNGRAHKRSINRVSMYGWLKKQGYPEGFRTLCWNCNAARGLFGYCPHEKERE